MNTALPITPPDIRGPVRETRKPKLKLPPGSCDCHCHICGPQTRYRYAEGRRYTPPDALLDDYIAMLRTVGVDRGVLVQPSIYMTDNSVILDALAEKRFPLRAVAVVADTVTDAELRRMHDLGVRGLRLNLRNSNGATPDMAPGLAVRIREMGWHLQFRIGAEDFPAVEPMIRSLAVPVVIDHMGQVPIADGMNGASFQSILRLAADGKAYVKISAPMRMSAGEYPYADVLPFVHALVKANPDRMLWATDWPHTTITKVMPNDGDLVDLLADWFPDPAVMKKVMVDNPARVYGF